MSGRADRVERILRVSEKPGRYQRSTSGLVGALIVTLLAIGAFVAFRALNREELEIKPEPIDYLAAVEQLQDSGSRPVHPPRLPEGWIATSVDVVPGRRDTWGLGVLTDEGAFVGIRQADSSAESLVEEYVDAEAAEGDVLGIPESDVAVEWLSWTDEGGDTGYSAEVGQQSVLVYGSAPAAEIQAYVATLTR